jgi:hypothetical protein
VHKKDDPLKCDTCGSSDVYLVSYERAAEALKGGAYSNLDPDTGKPESR